MIGGVLEQCISESPVIGSSFPGALDDPGGDYLSEESVRLLTEQDQREQKPDPERENKGVRQLNAAWAANSEADELNCYTTSADLTPASASRNLPGTRS